LKRHILVLAALSVILFFVGSWLLPVTDPVEANYAETAKEMLEAGDYLSPRIYGNYWYDKPVFFYLELVAAFKLFGVSAFAARIFPGVFATAGVLLTYFFGRRLYGGEIGFTAAVVMATTLEYWYLGHAIITDMTLFVFMAATLIAFYLGYEQNRPGYYVMAFISAALAVLTKGPLGLALPGMIIFLFLAWERRLKELFRWQVLAGLLLFLLLAGLWYVPMYRLHGEEFLNVFFGVHNVLRATVSEHPRDDVWYYYLVVFFAGFFPWSFIWFGSEIKKLWRWRGNASKTLALLQNLRTKLPADKRERFLWVWGITVPIVFQFMATKYLTYSFPYMIPIAILLAVYFYKQRRSVGKIALGATALYTGLLFTVAQPLCEMKSGQPTAQAFDEWIQAGVVDQTVQVVSYGIHYPASTVFYTGLDIKRLEPEANIAQVNTHERDWSATNVMPLLAIERIDPDRPVLVLTNADKIAELKKILPGCWQKLGQNGKLEYYMCEL